MVRVRFYKEETKRTSNAMNNEGFVVLVSEFLLLLPSSFFLSFSSFCYLNEYNNHLWSSWEVLFPFSHDLRQIGSDNDLNIVRQSRTRVHLRERTKPSIRLINRRHQFSIHSEITIRFHWGISVLFWNMISLIVRHRTITISRWLSKIFRAFLLINDYIRLGNLLPYVMKSNRRMLLLFFL